MKNALIGLNVVLGIGLIVLYVLHFSGSEIEQPEKSVAAKSDSTGFRVAYIKSDSLTANYQYVIDQNDALEKRSTQMDADYRNRAQSLQREFNEYQGNLSNLTIGQAKSIEEGLAKKEQNLRVFQERLRQELLQIQSETSQTLYQKVTDFLKEYSEENNIDMVVKFDTQSDVLYAGEGLDITAIVVEELNKRYEMEQNGDTVQNSDSTAIK